uniref:Ankyrin repeat and kinase domain containing 1 n=1 Tax=Poecilia reticulata TaxID=8081 RepID=A0A3P9QHC8_POERE
MNTHGLKIKISTPLHLAALKGHAGICRQLLSNGANPNCKTDQGWTPMHLAALRGHEAVVLKLLAAKADPNVKEESDGWTPLDLHYAFTGLILHLKDSNVWMENQEFKLTT